MVTGMIVGCGGGRYVRSCGGRVVVLNVEVVVVVVVLGLKVDVRGGCVVLDGKVGRGACVVAVYIGVIIRVVVVRGCCVVLVGKGGRGGCVVGVYIGVIIRVVIRGRWVVGRGVVVVVVLVWAVDVVLGGR